MNPYSYASALPYLTTEWSLTGQEDASLESSWREVGVALQPATSGGVAVLRTGSPGKVVVSVRVRISQSSTQGQYQVSRNYIVSKEDTNTARVNYVPVPMLLVRDAVFEKRTSSSITMFAL
jgi:hypothetical protein